MNRVALGEKEVQASAPEILDACFDTASVAMLLRMCTNLAAPRYGSKTDDR